MRELKFRAWDTISGEWVETVNIRGESRREFNIYSFPITPAEIRNNLIIEQFTGLKDKNGKEIYEGDIVLVANHGRTPYVVTYREWDCSFICKNENLVDFVHMFKTMPQCYEMIGDHEVEAYPIHRADPTVERLDGETPVEFVCYDRDDDGYTIAIIKEKKDEEV